VIEYLKGLDVEQVIVGGLALDFCVKTTALQLVAAGFKVIIHLPACRAISEEGAFQAIQDMQQAGVSVAATREETICLANA
jgi:nicotinamidase/pyrazinamidase